MSIINKESKTEIMMMRKNHKWNFIITSHINYFLKDKIMIISAEAPGFPHHQSREKGGDRSPSTPFPDPTNGHREEPSGQMVIFFIVDFRELFRFFYSPGVDQEHLGEHSPSSRKVQKGLYLKTSS